MRYPTGLNSNPVSKFLLEKSYKVSNLAIFGSSMAGLPPICRNEIPGEFQELYIFFQETQKVKNIPETVHIEENIEE